MPKRGTSLGNPTANPLSLVSGSLFKKYLNALPLSRGLKLSSDSPFEAPGQGKCYLQASPRERRFDEVENLASHCTE